MARKRLSVRSDSKVTELRKKLKMKDMKPDLSIDLLFSHDTSLFCSGSLLTDNDNVILFIDEDFLIKHDLHKRVEKFLFTENDLKVKYNKDEELTPVHLEESEEWYFEPIGKIPNDIFKWFKTTYPNCAFYTIYEWFGKNVNTLVIVLEEKLAKPVGIVKTIE